MCEIIKYKVNDIITILAIIRAINTPNRPCPDKTKNEANTTSKIFWKIVNFANFFICPNILYVSNPVRFKASKIRRIAAILIKKEAEGSFNNKLAKEFENKNKSKYNYNREWQHPGFHYRHYFYFQPGDARAFKLCHHAD